MWLLQGYKSYSQFSNSLRRSDDLLKTIRGNVSKTSIYKKSQIRSLSGQNYQLKSLFLNIEYRRNLFSDLTADNSHGLIPSHQNMAYSHHAPELVSKAQLKEFKDFFPHILHELTEEHQLPEDAMQRNTKMLQRIVPTGKMLLGITTVMAYKMLEKPKLLTPENIRLSLILGWCVQLMFTSAEIIDDIIDGSVTRRGELCWYRQPGIGLTAINDAIIMEHQVYYLLEKHFSKHPSYVSLINVLHENILNTYKGQVIDALCRDGNGKPKLDLFTMERYISIIKLKAAYFHKLPTVLAIHLAGIIDEELHRQAKSILNEIGHYAQVKNDFLDCFGDTSKTGKIGTDIQEGKCSWLAVIALERALPAQRKIIEKHYGKSELESVGIIRQLYEDLGLRAAYAKYEKESYNMTSAHIQQMSNKLPHDLFIKILNIMYCNM